MLPPTDALDIEYRARGSLCTGHRLQILYKIIPIVINDKRLQLPEIFSWGGILSSDDLKMGQNCSSMNDTVVCFAIYNDDLPEEVCPVSAAQEVWQLSMRHQVGYSPR